MPRILGPRNSAGSEDDHVHLNSEEKISLSTLLELADIKSILSRVRKIFTSGRGIHPAGAHMDSGALFDSIVYLKRLVKRHPTHKPGAHIWQSELIPKEARDSVATLVLARDVYGVKNLGLLRALAVRNDDLGELMRDTCLDARVSPEEFFHMLPISADLQWRGFEKPARYSEICHNLEQWRAYVRIANDRQRRRDLTEATKVLLPVHGPFNSASIFVDNLMKDGKPRNVEAFLEYLRGIKEMEVFAEDATLLLLTNHPDVTEKMLQSWAKAELDPLEALSRLPWGMFNPHRYREGTLKIPDIALCNWLGQFLRYVTLYRRGHTFADEKVDPWLRKVPRTNARAYLMILQDHRDEVGGSGELAKGLLALHEPTEEDSAVTDEILAKLRMQHPPWSTATVDRLQALSNA